MQIFYPSFTRFWPLHLLLFEILAHNFVHWISYSKPYLPLLHPPPSCRRHLVADQRWHLWPAAAAVFGRLASAPLANRHHRCHPFSLAGRLPCVAAPVVCLPAPLLLRCRLPSPASSRRARSQAATSTALHRRLPAWAAHTAVGCRAGMHCRRMTFHGPMRRCPCS